MSANRVCGMAMTLVVGACSGAYGQGRPSSDAAGELLKTLRERQMQHVAAKDPAEAGRYLAAAVIGDSNLLLVSARYAQPVLLDERLYRDDHQGVYTELNAASIREGKLFVQDLGEPGLRSTRQAEGGFDIVYRSGGKGTLFDGNWKAQGLSKQAYFRAFEQADAQYAHAIEALISVVAGKAPPVVERP